MDDAMKSTTLLLFLGVLTVNVYAQENRDEMKEFTDYTKQLEQQRQNASGKNEYRNAVRLIHEWLAHYNQEPEVVKNNFVNYVPGMYYNLACYYALDGQKDSSVGWFDKCVDAGWSDYAHTLVDSDLNSVRNDKRFKESLARMQEKYDYGYILKKAGTYHNGTESAYPVFAYQPASAAPLVALKQRFNLDSIAGPGDDTARMKRLLLWVHNRIKHDGGSDNPKQRNAADLIEVCDQEKRGVNCRMLATVLRDVYQAEGYPARMVTCMPKDTADNDCHVITVVWSKVLNKWVWMDPTFNAYVRDDKGLLLNIEEVRERLIKGQPLLLNEDANWNNKTKETKAEYLDYYMSKNLYWIKCHVKSEWDVETRKENWNITYVNLYPSGFSTINNQGQLVTGPVTTYATNNSSYFWQKPVTE